MGDVNMRRGYDCCKGGRNYGHHHGRRWCPGPQQRSRAELRLEEYLLKWGLPFKTQVPIKTQGGTFVVDFLVAGRCVVECEGRVHSDTLHRKNVLWDSVRENLIEAEGFRVIRLANFQVFMGIDYCRQKILASCAG